MTKFVSVKELAYRLAQAGESAVSDREPVMVKIKSRFPKSAISESYPIGPAPAFEMAIQAAIVHRPDVMFSPVSLAWVDVLVKFFGDDVAGVNLHEGPQVATWKEFVEKAVSQIHGLQLERTFPHRVLCCNCSVILDSRHDRDYKYCDCGSVAIDGGPERPRLIGDLDAVKRLDWDYTIINEKERECHNCPTNTNPTSTSHAMLAGMTKQCGVKTSTKRSTGTSRSSKSIFKRITDSIRKRL